MCLRATVTEVGEIAVTETPARAVTLAVEVRALAVEAKSSGIGRRRH